MNDFARELLVDDVRSAAEYYAAIEPIDRIEVVEADTVPVIAGIVFLGMRLTPEDSGAYGLSN